MSAEHAAERAEALIQLERTRMQWILRSTSHPQGEGDGAPAAAGNPLNDILTDWLTNEIAARLWPEPPADGDGAHSQPDDGNAEHRAAEAPPLPSQVLAETVSDWTSRHPWLGVISGLLAGGLAMSQRQRLLRWAVSAALPWLAANASTLALPLLAHWLARQPMSGAVSTTPGSTAMQDDAPSPSPDETPSPAQGSRHASANAPPSAGTGQSGQHDPG